MEEITYKGMKVYTVCRYVQYEGFTRVKREDGLYNFVNKQGDFLSDECEAAAPPPPAEYMHDDGLTLSEPIQLNSVPVLHILSAFIHPSFSTTCIKKDAKFSLTSFVSLFFLLFYISLRVCRTFRIRIKFNHLLIIRFCTL